MSTLATGGSAASVGDIIGLALDLDNQTLKVTRNGAHMTTASNIPQYQWFFAGSDDYTSYSATHEWNFGQQRFKYGLPSGYAALNTTALPAATITDGSAYFDSVTYTGNGTSYLNSQTISGLSFSPDFLWIKCRSNTADHHLANTVKGINKNLESNNNGSNQTNNNNGYISATTSDGFTVVYGAIDGLQTNDNSKTYVAWAWDAASSTSSNTDGSITSQVRASQTAGFSVVAYTGTGSNATVGHGLNAKPDFYVVKRSGTADDLETYHSSLGATKYGKLNATDTFTSAGGTLRWNDTEPTSSVFSVGTTDNVNGSSSTYVAYCFAAVAGYSAFGLYEGNGSSNGPFVYTGFAPAFVMFKRSDSTGDWIIFDNKRNTHEGNYREKVLYPNKINAEETSANGDTMLFLSNGFKLNNVTYAYWNASGGDYVWAAFAENPFQANGGLAR